MRDGALEWDMDDRLTNHDVAGQGDRTIIEFYFAFVNETRMGT